MQHGGNEAGVARLPPVEGKPLLHLADGFPHQQSPADLIQRALRQAAAFPEDLFRQAGEAEQGDILLLLPGKEGTDPALHLKGGVLRHQQDLLAALSKLRHPPQHGIRFSRFGTADQDRQHSDLPQFVFFLFYHNAAAKNRPDCLFFAAMLQWLRYEF